MLRRLAIKKMVQSVIAVSVVDEKHNGFGFLNACRFVRCLRRVQLRPQARALGLCAVRLGQQLLVRLRAFRFLFLSGNQRG